MRRGSSLWRRVGHIRNRQAFISAIEVDVREHGYPRLQMLLILLISSAGVFLASSLLWHLGMDSLWIRYLCAMLLGYVVFLLVLYLWLRIDKGEMGLDVFSVDYTNTTELDAHSMGGGDPAGGGASGSWESFDVSTGLVHDQVEPLSAAASGGSDGGGFSLDVDEGAIPILLIVAALAAVFSSLYVVYIAPSLFAELTADLLLALYSHRFLKRIERRNWLGSALKKTIIPFVFSLVLVVGLALFVHTLEPEAHTLSQFLIR